MPISRFAFYFFALAACSTIAFASGLAGKSKTNDGTTALEAAAGLPLPASERAALRRHPSPLKISVVAQAN
jgi:hypothetical protein